MQTTSMSSTTLPSPNTGFLRSLALATVTIAVASMALGMLWLRAHGA